MTNAADTSTSVAERNLAVLQGATSVEVVARLREAAVLLRREEAREAPFELVPTSSGNPSCRFQGRYVYSRHDPMAEARRIVAREIPAPTTVCIFHNFALAYHVEAFLDAFPHGRAIVLEPDLAAFAAAMEARDLSRLLADPRLLLLLEAEPDVLAGAVDQSLGTTVHVVRLRGLAGKNEDYFARIERFMQSMVTRKDVNRNTLARFGRLWVRNLVQNIDLIADAPGIRPLMGAFSGIPALVLAAGPSLDEALAHIEGLKERFLIVCVDTSYRAVLRMRVEPDFLVVVDPQYWNSRHLDGCPGDGTILVSESSTYPGVFRHFRGTISLCGSLFPLGGYLEERVETKGRLGAGGSVSTTAWDFARALGCGPIVFAGLDLGFPAHKTHFSGGFFEQRTHLLSSREQPAEALSFHALYDARPYAEENNVGGTTLTDHRLVVYKWWFEGQMKIHPEAQTRTLSREAIRIDGITPISIEEALSYPAARSEIDRRMERFRAQSSQTNRSGLRPKLAAAVSELTADLSQLGDAARRALSAVDRLERAIDRGESMDYALEELQSLDRVIGSASTRDIAGFLMHGATQAILDGTASEASPRAIVETSRAFYRNLADAAVYHLDCLRTARISAAASRR